jgi:hypothetical protein
LGRAGGKSNAEKHSSSAIFKQAEHSFSTYEKVIGQWPIKGCPKVLYSRRNKQMPKFKQGSKVGVRLDTSSPYRGRTGIVGKEPIKDSSGYWYMVQFVSKGFSRVYRFVEQDLELMNTVT